MGTKSDLCNKYESKPSVNSPLLTFPLSILILATSRLRITFVGDELTGRLAGKWGAGSLP
jgi:hypothetical protein